jgi:hypothetical protein
MKRVIVFDIIYRTRETTNKSLINEKSLVLQSERNNNTQFSRFLTACAARNVVNFYFLDCARQLYEEEKQKKKREEKKKRK